MPTTRRTRGAQPADAAAAAAPAEPASAAAAEDPASDAPHAPLPLYGAVAAHESTPKAARTRSPRAAAPNEESSRSKRERWALQRGTASAA